MGNVKETDFLFKNLNFILTTCNFRLSVHKEYQRTEAGKLQYQD